MYEEYPNAVIIQTEIQLCKKNTIHFYQTTCHPESLIVKLRRASAREARIQAAFTDGVAAANPGQETLKSQSVTSVRR